MAKVSTSISIDSEVREKALPILNELGLDLSTAVGVFLRQTIRDQAALREFQDMREHPERYKRYSSFGDALKEVLSDA